MFKVSYTDIRDLGDERLLAIGSLRMRGRGSGVESDVASAAVVQFRDGVMQEVKDYGDGYTRQGQIRLNGRPTHFQCSRGCRPVHSTDLRQPSRARHVTN